MMLFTVVALMMVMLAIAASSAMAFRFPPPPSPGEPVYSGSGFDIHINDTLVTHCGSHGTDDEHGAITNRVRGSDGLITQSGNCVVAPPAD